MGERIKTKNLKNFLDTTCKDYDKIINVTRRIYKGNKKFVSPKK